MNTKTRSDAGSLIVVSRDYEEFGLAMSFVRNQEFATRARMLLPDGLHAINKDSLPVPASPYTTLEDITRVVDAHRPDLVLLFSAYSFSFGPLLSPEPLDRLLRHLRNRGCRVMTSDPFLGLAPRLTLADIDRRMLAPGEPAVTRWLVRLVVHFRSPMARLVQVPRLDDVIHLYPASIPACEDGITRLSFFNPTVAGGTANVHAAGGEREHWEPHDPRPRWLFLLSTNDLHVQRVRLGLAAFLEQLLGMLRHGLEAERHPTLIAPYSIVDRVAPALGDSVEMLPVGRFAELEKRLLDAEYVFDWSAFSFAQLTRLASERPVFSLDRGYFARTVTPFYEIARACYLGGWEPTYLDQRQLFSPYVLAHLAKKQKPAMRALKERWRSSPTPDQVVDRLLR